MSAPSSIAVTTQLSLKPYLRALNWDCGIRMNPDSGRLIAVAPDQPLPAGFLEVPAALAPAARSLLNWAATTKAAKRKRKQERQSRRRGRR